VLLLGVVLFLWTTTLQRLLPQHLMIATLTAI
jgi:hypothetical protein